MDDITSIFTPAGTNAASQQGQRNAAVAKVAESLLPTIQDLVNSWKTKAPDYQKKKQAAADMLVRLLDPVNMTSEANQMKNSVYDNAAQAQRQAGLSSRSMGFGDAFISGQNASIAGQASRQAADVDASRLDPQKRLSRVNAWLAAIEQSGKIPGIDELSKLSSIIYGQPQVQVQQGFGSILGNMAGGYLGGGGGAAAGGAVGGGIGAGTTQSASPYQLQGGSYMNYNPQQQSQSQISPWQINTKLW